MNKRKMTIYTIFVFLVLLTMSHTITPAVSSSLETDYFEQNNCEFAVYVEFYCSKASAKQIESMTAEMFEESIVLEVKYIDNDHFAIEADEKDELDYYIQVGESAVIPDVDYTEQEVIDNYGGYTQLYNISSINDWNTSTEASYYADTESKFTGNRYYVGGERSPNEITNNYALSNGWTFVNISKFEVLSFPKGITDLAQLGIGFHTSIASANVKKNGFEMFDVLKSAYFPILRSKTTTSEGIFGRIKTTVTRPLNTLIELSGNVLGSLLNKPEGATHYYPTSVPSSLFNNKLFAMASQFSLGGFLSGSFNWVAAIFGSVGVFLTGLIITAFVIYKKRKNVNKRIQKTGNNWKKRLS